MHPSSSEFNFGNTSAPDRPKTKAELKEESRLAKIEKQKELERLISLEKEKREQERQQANFFFSSTEEHDKILLDDQEGEEEEQEGEQFLMSDKGGS